MANQIDSIDPLNGPINGGNLVKITLSSGLLIDKIIQIWFGNTQITSYIFSFDKEIYFMAPMSTTGSGIVNVKVETNTGLSDPVNYEYIDNNLPTLTSISPNSGNDTTQVTLIGEGFFGSFYVNNPINNFQTNNTNFGTNGTNPFQNVVTSLTINGKKLKLSVENDFIVVDTSTIKILNMPFNPDGQYDVVVNTLYGSTKPLKFTYFNIKPNILNVTSDCDLVTISTSGITDFSNISVLFGNQFASYIVNGNNIIATLPTLKEKCVILSIISPAFKITTQFKYCVPKIKKIKKCDNIFTISGKHFFNIQSVFFNDIEAKIISIHEGEKIRVTIDNLECGKKYCVVVNNSNNFSSKIYEFIF